MSHMLTYFLNSYGTLNKNLNNLRNQYKAKKIVIFMKVQPALK